MEFNVQWNPVIEEMRPGSANPWLNEEIVFSVAVWWVRNTQDDAEDFSRLVSREYTSLARDLRRQAAELT